MRTLSHALRTAYDRFIAYSPQSRAGFGLLRPPLPGVGIYAAHADVLLGLDETGQPASVPRGASVLIAGDPRTSVTTTLRTLTLGYARYAATRVHVFEPDLFGELDPLRGLAHCYIDTAHGGATIRRATEDLRALADEIARRRQLLNDLNADLAAAAPAIRRATGQGAPRLTTLAEIRKVPLRVWDAAGINTARTDSEISDLHQHVVVIGNAIRWVLSDSDGQAFTGALARVALGGPDMGVAVLLATPSAYLPYLPPHLTGAFEIRIALQLQNPDHADQILGALARQSGIDASRQGPDDTAPFRSGRCWIANLTIGGEPGYQRAQVYDANPRAFRAQCTRLTRIRARTNWLTGDAADQGR